MPTSYNGWLIGTPAQLGLTPFPFTSGAGVRGGDVWTLLHHFAAWYHTHIEPIDPADSYDYAYRRTRGATSWSCHASGTAIDLNATRHPWKTTAGATLTPDQIAAIRAQLGTYRGAIRWLETTDPMHYEIRGTEAFVHTIAATLANPDPLAPEPPPYPLPAGSYFGPRYPESNTRSVSGYYLHGGDLARWQQRMVERGWNITPDGRYGPQTRRVAAAFQHEKGLTVDGLIGPATWAAAWTLPTT